MWAKTSCFPEIWGKQKMSLTFPPFGSSIFEPYLHHIIRKMNTKRNEFIILTNFHLFTENTLHTRIRGSARFVHIEISSRTLISGYLFLENNASNSCNCWDVKWVRCLLPLLLLALSPAALFALPLLPLEHLPKEGSLNWLSGLSELWLGDSFCVLSRKF